LKTGRAAWKKLVSKSILQRSRQKMLCYQLLNIFGIKDKKQNRGGRE